MWGVYFLDSIVTARGLRKIYGFNVALDGIDLDVERGGVHLVIGPNGSGKSTLLSIIAGAERPTSGYVRVLGLDPWRDNSRLAGRVKALLDRTSLNPWDTLRDVVELQSKILDVSLDEYVRVAELLGVTGFWDRPYVTYSTGMRRKALLLLALTGEPELLVLDEPFQGLDRYSVRMVTKLILEKAKKGVTVLIATHILPRRLVENAKSMTRMELGRIVQVTRASEKHTLTQTHTA